jgi:hypothetical protein
LIPALVMLAVLLILFWRALFGSEKAVVDRSEVLVLKGISDRIRKEQIHPFE